MNKFKIGIVVVVVLVVVGYGYYLKKEYFDEGSVLTTPVMNADKVTRISSAGGDMRLYEFTPRTAPYMQCIFITGTNKGSTFCFRKESNVENNQTTN